MPYKRKSKHVLSLTSVTLPNSSNGLLSPREQGDYNQSHIFISTPSIAQLGINRTTQFSVDPTDFVNTSKQEASSVMYLMVFSILLTNSSHS